MAFKGSFKRLLNHKRLLKYTLTYTHKSSNTTSRREDCYRAKKLNNLMVISKSYIKKMKAFMLNNKAIKASKHPKKGHSTIV